LVVEAVTRVRGRQAQVVDVGCGSGCIALGLASELPEARIYATEISPAALAVARENARRHEMDQKIEFLQGDLLDPLANKGMEGTLDLVATNPPYITDSDMKSLEPEVREYEPRLALEAGVDGLSVVRRLLPQAQAFLKPGGHFILEVGINMENPVRDLIDASELSWEKTVPDLQGIPRVLVAKK
jgi:release factor glutamine methyltransferase